MTSRRFTHSFQLFLGGRKMQNIEKLLEVFPEGLYVRHEEVIPESKNSKKDLRNVSYTRASLEVKEAFKAVLRENLLSKLEKCSIGEKISYSFYLGTVHSPHSVYHGDPAQSINQNLQEVIDKLPKLPEGEEYVFPDHTSVSVKVIGFDQGKSVTSLDNLCSWLRKALQ